MSCTDLFDQFEAAANCAGDLLILAYGPYANDRILSSTPAHRDRLTLAEFTNPQNPPTITLSGRIFGSVLQIPGCDNGAYYESCDVDLAAWDGFATSPPNLMSKLTIKIDLWSFYKTKLEMTVNAGAVNGLLAPLSPGQCDEVAWWLPAGTEDPPLPLEIGGSFGTASKPIQVIWQSEERDVGPFFSLVSVCKEDDEPAPSITLAGWLGPELQDRVFDDSPVPPHAPLIFTFDTDMAWATLLINDQTGAEDQNSRQQFAGDLVNRLEIIPNDGLGFAPGSTLTLQMLSRSPMLQGFPYPPSSVSTDGQALTSPYLKDITIAEVRIDAISDATHFSPPEFATVTSSLFQGVVELVPGATQTLGLFTRSLDAAGHPASPLVYVDTASALGAGETTIVLDPPAVRSGHGMIEVWDSDRLDHWDYAFYDWQPPWRIVSPSDGDDQQLRDEVVVQIVVPESDVTEFYFVGGTGVFVEAGATSATAVADLSFGWSTFMLEGDNLVPLDARTIRISEDVIGIPVKVWKVCEDLDLPGYQPGVDITLTGACAGLGTTVTDETARTYFDDVAHLPSSIPPEDPTISHANSVDDIFSQANVQFRLVEIGVIVTDQAIAQQPGCIEDIADLASTSGVINLYFAQSVVCDGQTVLGVGYVDGKHSAVSDLAMGSQHLRTTGHELGHNLGLEHVMQEDDPDTGECVCFCGDVERLMQQSTCSSSLGVLLTDDLQQACTGGPPLNCSNSVSSGTIPDSKYQQADIEEARDSGTSGDLDEND